MKKKDNLKKRLVIYAAAAVVLFVFCSWQNNTLTVTEHIYKNEKISDELDDFTIVHISDLHNKNFGKEQKRIAEKITELAPDIIVITGDIVDSRRTNIPKALEFAEKAAEIADTYYVTGNHEHRLDDEDFEKLMNGLEQTGVKCLTDESVDIEKNGGSFVLSGFDDESLVNIEYNCPKLAADKLNVVLAHEPQLIEDYSNHGNIDLVLTGHAHGGQFRLLFIGAVYAPDQGINPEYTEGMHKMGDTSMIVSRGIGNSALPVRLFNFPEIIKITLKSEKAD
ncbi:MAG: metallophosphoesterase [Ruminococcus sp.]|nr:metallophosphoesterase [Ruminococcus sp.]